MNKKIFLLHNMVSPYRLPLFEKLSEKFDLDVKFCKSMTKDRLWSIKLEDYSFKNEILKSVSIGPLVINYSLPFKLLSNKYEVYIVGGGVETIFSGFIVFLIAKLFEKPFILWSGEINGYECESSIFRKVMRRCYHIFKKKLLYPLADSFIAYGVKAKEFLIKDGVPHYKIFVGTQVISEDMVDKMWFSKSETEFKDKKIILYLGYFYKRKGIKYLIKAFKKIHFKDAVLVIAGSGEEENNLKSLARGIKNIYFVGYVEGEKKFKYYSIADIFVHPTLHDPWANTVNEAMYFGLPIIATNKDGCSRELINGNGFVVEAGDEDELKCAIEKLLNDDELRRRMGIRSKEIIKKYNLDYAVGAFLNAIRLALEAKSKMKK